MIRKRTAAPEARVQGSPRSLKSNAGLSSPCFASRRLTTTLILLTVAAFTGCKSWNLKKDIPWAKDRQERDQRVVKMVSSWQDTTMHLPGKSMERGFAGRIYFHNPAGDPVAVDGHLVVYAYDEEMDSGRPTRRFVLTPEQLATHYSLSKIGASYSVWLPWDEMGRDAPQKQIQLVPTFQPAIGPAVVGEPTYQRLSPLESQASKQKPVIRRSQLGSISNAAYEPETTKGRVTNASEMSSSNSQRANYHSQLKDAPSDRFESNLDSRRTRPKGQIRETTIELTPNTERQIGYVRSRDKSVTNQRDPLPRFDDGRARAYGVSPFDMRPPYQPPIPAISGLHRTSDEPTATQAYGATAREASQQRETSSKLQSEMTTSRSKKTRNPMFNRSTVFDRNPLNDRSSMLRRPNGGRPTAHSPWHRPTPSSPQPESLPTQRHTAGGNIGRRAN